MADPLTVAEVGARLGLKPGMVRRYALALEAVTGVSIPVDPVRGRLYPSGAVELLEAARAYLLAHPGESVEGALRAVTGQGEGEAAPPARVPGTLTPADLQTALDVALARVTGPLVEELEAQRREAEALRAEVAELRRTLAQSPRELLAEVEGLRAQVARLEVTTHAALATAANGNTAPPRTGLLAVLARLFGR